MRAIHPVTDRWFPPVGQDRHGLATHVDRIRFEQGDIGDRCGIASTSDALTGVECPPEQGRPILDRCILHRSTRRLRREAIQLIGQSGRGGFNRKVVDRAGRLRRDERIGILEKARYRGITAAPQCEQDGQSDRRKLVAGQRKQCLAIIEPGQGHHSRVPQMEITIVVGPQHLGDRIDSLDMTESTDRHDRVVDHPGFRIEDQLYDLRSTLRPTRFSKHLRRLRTDFTVVVQKQRQQRSHGRLRIVRAAGDHAQTPDRMEPGQLRRTGTGHPRERCDRVRSS